MRHPSHSKPPAGPCRRTLRQHTIAWLLAAGLLAVSGPGATFAQEAPRPRQVTIPAGSLATALDSLGEQTGVLITYPPDLVDSRESPAVSGRLTPVDALRQLLAETGLTWQAVNGSTFVLRRAEAAQGSEAGADATEEEPSGTLTGRVTQAGKPVAGATVTATSEALEEPRVVTTDDEGNYELTDLPSGEYSLRLELEGLAPVVKEAEVSPDESTTLDIQMSLHEVREDMVVVGSRLGSTPVESALPIKVLDREQIDRSGATTVAEALSLLPELSIRNNGDNRETASGLGSGSTNSTAVQLRGLPLGTTLVLVNGRRVGNSAVNANRGSNAFFDLTNVPLSMVERIEVLPYGASAVYGGDGLAGVVNIVTRRNAQGLDVRVRNSQASGYDESQANVTWGQSWSRGSLTATASFLKTGTLRESERALTRNADFRRFGGQDWRLASFANPGTVYSLDGCPPPPDACFSVPLEERGNLPGLDAPVAGIPAGQDGQGLTPADFAATAGLRNLGDNSSRKFSGSETTSLTLQGRYELSSWLELFGEVLYTRRDVPAFENFLQISGGEFGLAVVSAENPFNPFGVDVGVDVLQESTGIFWDFQPEYLLPQLGLRGSWGDWTWELQGSLSKDLTDGGFLENDGGAVRAALASSDPATALSPFRGDGSSFGSPELIESFFTPEPFSFTGDLWQTNGFVRGPLARLPAGRVEALLGVEWERQELERIRVPDDPESTFNVSGSDEAQAAFAEIRLPLVARSRGSSGGQSGRPGSPGEELLAISGAFRVDESDRFEGTGTTETVALTLRPTSSLLLRATSSSAFKPPSSFAAFDATEVFPFVFITDPQFGGQAFFVDLLSGGGIPPGLKAERSMSTTVGLVWTPRSRPGLNLSVTGWQNRLRDRLARVGAQLLVDNEAFFPNRVIRDLQTGVITTVDDRPVNIVRTDTEGVDLGLSWRWSTRHGEFTPSLAATWMGKHEEQITSDSPVEDRLAVLKAFSFSGWSPRWKGTTSLNWALADKVQATLIGRYVSAYEDPQPLDTGPQGGTVQTLGDFWMFDLNADWKVGRWLAPGAARFQDTHLVIGATNLFNRLPDYCNTCGSLGYDASQYDLRGRFVHTELRFSF